MNPIIEHIKKNVGKSYTIPPQSSTSQNTSWDIDFNRALKETEEKIRIKKIEHKISEEMQEAAPIEEVIKEQPPDDSPDSKTETKGKEKEEGELDHNQVEAEEIDLEWYRRENHLDKYSEIKERLESIAQAGNSSDEQLQKAENSVEELGQANERGEELTDLGLGITSRLNSAIDAYTALPLWAQGIIASLVLLGGTVTIYDIKKTVELRFFRPTTWPIPQFSPNNDIVISPQRIQRYIRENPVLEIVTTMELMRYLVKKAGKVIKVIVTRK